MGNSESRFNEQELEEYQELTFFTKKEILHVFERFEELDPQAVKKDRNARLPKETILQLKELKVNPFGERICDVFSSQGDGTISFEDFLDMMSVFSDGASRHVKVEYAFKIYDFDGDDSLSTSDLTKIVNCLTQPKKLEKEQMKILIDTIMIEADLDNDGSLSFAEFQHVMSKSPDFVNMFKIRL